MFKRNKSSVLLVFFVLLFSLLAASTVCAAGTVSANFTSNVTNGSAPLSVQFNDTSTGTPTSWSWNFGDNSTSTEQNPTHVYKSLGNFTVSLNVSNGVSNSSISRLNYISTGNTTTFSDYRNVNVYVANDGGVRFDVPNGVSGGTFPYSYVPDTYFVYFRVDGGGLNPIHISTSNTGASATTSTDQSGTFWITFTGGQPTMPEAILMVAVNGTIADNFALHLTSTGYQWDMNTPAVGNDFTTNNLTYVVGAVNETFTKSDLIYGPQIWKFCSVANYPIFTGQDMSNTTNTFQFMMIDLYAGALQSGIENGAIRIDYNFTGLETGNLAAFNVYGWYSASNHGTGIIMTNAGSGYCVRGVSAAVPVANFTSNSTSGVTPLTVQFTDTSSNSPTSWSWNFGDGSTSSDANPSHTYTTPGTYTVTLTVTNSAGNNTLSQTGYITVNNVTGPTVNATPDASIYNSTQTVTLTSDQPDSTIYYTTDGSDPTDSSNSNRVPYSNPIPINTTTTLNFAAVNSGGVWSTRYNKTYVIDSSTPTVTASPEGGDFNSTQTVTLTTVDLDTNTTTYYITDGTDPKSSSSRVVYSTPIGVSSSLTLLYAAVDEAGNWSPVYSQTYNITISTPPVASFTSNATSGTAPLSVQFNDTSSNTPTSWTWHFGDNTTSTEQNPTHTYSSAGTYTVTLTAANSVGNNTLTKSSLIFVFLNEAYVSPTGNDTTGNGSEVNPYVTIQKALDNVVSGGTVHLLAGTYSGAGNYGLTISKNVNIVGADQATTIIDAAGLGSIFTINSGVTVSIVNLTFENGNATNGSAISNGGTLTVNNCAFVNNNASGYGGAIFNNGTITELSNSTFTNNTANNHGGAVYNAVSIISLKECIFTNNTSSSAGGAISNFYGTINNLSNCTFTNNSAYSAGAIQDYSGSLSVSNCTFFGNKATNQGGVISTTSATLNMNNCSFTNNTASASAGVLYILTNSQVTLYNCTFTANTASNYAGAIYNTGTITMSGCNFNGNIVTTKYGGAIYNYVKGVLTVSNCTFTGNTASQYGGAIYNAQTLNVHFSSFSNNTATTGSAIYRASGTVNAQYNWWGSNSSPASQMYGTVDYSNWLYMTETVVPTTVANGTTAVVTVSFNNIWNGSAVVSIDPASGHIVDGTLVTFTSDLGSFSPVTANTTNGIATTTFTASNDIIGAINATTNSQTVSYLINRLATVISVGNVTGVSGESTNLTATLTDGNGTGLSGQNVTVTVNGSSYTATTDSNGLATVTVTAPVTAGTYNVTASFAGDSLYQPSSSNGTSYLTVQLRDVYVSPIGNDTSGTGTSSNPFATIQKGLETVVTGGTVHLKAGTYTGDGNKGLTITRDVNIVGEDQTTTIIDAQLSSNILTINSGVNVTIKNLTLENGTSTRGGAIYNSGTLNLSDCTFSGNAPNNNYGGAIYNTGTITSLTDCSFTYNTISSGYGGAICNYAGTINYITGCTFIGNKGNYGGAIYNYKGTITLLSDSIFIGTGMKGITGGAIYNNGGTMNIVGCNFTNHTSTTMGGAISNVGNMTINYCTFTNNTAKQRGGAIYTQIASSVFTVHFSSFVNNVSPLGSAIGCLSGTMNATYNWWGSNDPSGQIYTGSSVILDYSHWLYMTVTTDPSTLLNGSNATVTVSFNNIWNGTDVVSIDPASGHIPDGTVVNFSSLLGSFDPVSVTTTNGTASSTFTATATGIGVINATAGSVPVSADVTVYDVPVASFVANATQGMSPLSVQFTDTSSNVPSSWAWDFNGDGVVDSTLQNPTWTYSSTGLYTVMLTVANAAGNSTLTKTNYIVVDFPVANFTTNVTTGNDTLTVQFTDTSSNSPTGWLWNFGDGTTSTEQNSVHTYSKAGSYTVTLTVNNSYGSDSEVKTDYINITDTIPTVNITLPGGLYNTTLSVGLTTDDVTATIYYFINGTTSTKKYNGPVSVDSTSTLLYYAIDNMGNSSPIYMQNYIIDLVPPTVNASVPSGYYNVTKNVTLSSDDSTATIFCTVDGSDPMTSGTVYTAPVTVDTSLTLNFVARDPAGNWSPVGTETYFIDLIAPTVNVSVPGGIYNTTQNVTLTSDETANIYYTNDTTDPRTSSTRILYTGEIIISNTTALRFAAVDLASNWSPLYVLNYVIGTDGLADSAWSKFLGNLNNTGLSNYTGSQSNVLLWTYTTGGNIGYSSAVIGSDGTIYVGSSDGKLYAFNVDGTLKWAYTTGGAIYTTAAIGSDGTIYFGDYGDKKFYALNSNGTLKWTYTTGAGIIGSSPLISADGTIYVGSTDGKVYAFYGNGTVKWTYTTGGAIYSSPAMSSDGTIYIGSSDGKVYALNQDGTVKWSYHTGSVIYYSSPTLSSDGTIYIGTYNGKLFALYSDGTLKWSYNTGTYIAGTPTIGADGTVYVANYNGNLYAFATEGTVKWTYSAGDHIDGPVVIDADGTIYFGCESSYVYALNSNGTLKWRYATGTYITGSPSIGSDGTLYIGSLDKKLYAFKDVVPVANFASNITSGNNTLDVQFTDNSTYATSWSWDFGDGTTSTEENPAHTYTAAGVYTVILTVTNNFSNNTLTKVGYITVYDTIPPTVTANVTSGVYSTPQEVGLTASENATIYYTLNGVTSVYNDPVTINNSTTLVYVAVDTAGNWSPIYFQTYTIMALPETGFTSNVTSGTSPVNVQFTDTTTGNVTSWLWDFGDGTNSTLQNPTHTYNTAGTYNVSLTAGNAAGNNTVTKSSYISVYLENVYVSPDGNDTNGTGTSSSPYASIQKALQNVSTGGTVHVRSGTYTGAGNYGLTISRDVNIVGDDQSMTIIDATSLGNIFTINSGVTVTIENITFANGKSANGGVIYNAGTLNVVNSTFIGNTATTAGGAIYNVGTIGSIDGCNFISNAGTSTSTSYGGGAIFNRGNITSVSGCTFTNNTAATFGGAIFNRDNITSVIGCTFINNAASTNGGAIYNYNRGIITSVIGCTFTGNNAANMGGAIYNYRLNSAIAVINSVSACTFTNNTATSRGGAIWNGGTLILIDNCTFTGNNETNTASGAGGGAIYNSGTLTSVIGCTFTNNTAARGGAIMHYGSYTPYTTMDVHYCSFVNNIATLSGWGDAIAGYNGIVNATYNWWGSNNNPSLQILATSTPPGTVYYSNWLYMTLNVDPIIIVNGSTANVAVSFNNIWNGTDVVSIDPASGHIPDGTVVTFSSILGMFSPVTVTTTNGMASSMFAAATFSTVTDALNAIADNQAVFVNVTIYHVPVASFIANNTGGLDPLSVQFTDTSSNSPSSWAWDFNNDGVIDSTLQNPTWTYNTSGNYTVVLTVGNLAGNDTVTVTDYITVFNSTAPVVTVSPVGGLFNVTQDVTLSVDQAGSTIYYTLDGSDPTDTGNVNRVVYTHPVVISGTDVLNFAAVNAGGVWSSVYSETYVIDTVPPSVNASVPGGVYNRVQNVTLSSDDVYAVIYYTTDGSDPVSSGTRVQYTGPVVISNTTSLIFAALDPAGNWSPVVTENYTIDLVTPTVSVVDPASGAVNVSVNKTITVTFSEPVQLGSGWIELQTGNGTVVPVTVSVNGNKMIITPSSALSGSVKYLVLIHTGSLTDLSGNVVSAYLSTFTTVDTTAPKVTGVDPANGATNVSSSKVITVTFNEAIKLGSGWVELVTSNGTVIPVSLSVSGNKLIVTQGSALADGKYQLLIHTGSLTDLAGNVVSAYVSAFTVSTAPKVTGVDPASGAVNVSTGKVITVTYSKDVKLGTGWVELQTSNGTSVPVNLSVSGKVLTITPVSALASGIKYLVLVHTGSLTSLAGNPVSSYLSIFTTKNA